VIGFFRQSGITCGVDSARVDFSNTEALLFSLPIASVLTLPIKDISYPLIMFKLKGSTS